MTIRYLMDENVNPHREFVKVLSPCVTLGGLEFVKSFYLLECLEILDGDR